MNDSADMRPDAGEEGMTLIELVISIALLGIVIGPVTAMIMLGSEGQGLSSSVNALATRHVVIPMPGGTESLNLAVTAALRLTSASTSSLAPGSSRTGAARPLP